MGSLRQPSPVKLFVALLCNDSNLFSPVEAKLAELFGLIDSASVVLAWNVTEYYNREMGAGLLRRFISFEKLVEPSRLPGIKRQTHELESKYLWWNGACQGRSVNLDPGYLETTKVVLASTKNAAHRVYLDAGIYGEATLQFRYGSFEPFAHTYPDYRWPETLKFFVETRSVYLRQLRAGASPAS